MNSRLRRALLGYLAACFLFVSFGSAQIEEGPAKIKHVPKEVTRKELIMSLDCMLNRVLLVTRFDDPVTKEWAADGLLRVKYVISDDRFYPAGNLFVLVLKKKSDSYGYIVFYKWNRKTRHESFSLENDSLVHKGRRGWDAKAPLGGVGTLEYFNQTLRRMAKMPVIEIPVQDVTRTGASCTYYGQLPPGEN